MPLTHSYFLFTSKYIADHLNPLQGYHAYPSSGEGVIFDPQQVAGPYRGYSK